MRKHKIRALSVVIPVVVVLFNMLIIIFPSEVVRAAAEGVGLWFNNALPALLPFVIGTNMIAALGLTKYFGKLLEPMMRALFKLSGSSGYVLAVGLLSGYPMGARATATMLKSGELTKRDADILVCFANNSGPLFILGAVAAGMFKNVMAGYFILFVHYSAALAGGLIFSSLAPVKSGESGIKRPAEPAKREVGLGAAFSSSVTGGMETMLAIGGYIILFSVVLRMLEVTGAFSLVESLFGGFIMNPEMGRAILSGLIELTNGLKRLSQLGLPRTTLITASALIGFGGFSIHAQSLSFMADINAVKYMLAKLVHAFLSIIIGLLVMPFFYEAIINSQSVAVFRFLPPADRPLSTLFYSAVFYVVLCVTLFSLAVLIAIVRMTSGKKYPRSRPRGIKAAHAIKRRRHSRRRNYRGI